MTDRLQLSHGQDTELTWLPAWQLRELMVRREVSAVAVTNHFLERIERLDPVLHLFRTIDPAAARRQAEAADRALSAGEPAGILHGVPIAVKEHLAVRGLPCLHMTSMAATEAAMPVAERDFIVVERLRQAGAVRAKFDALLERYDALLSPTIQFTAPTVSGWNESWRDIMAFSPVYTSATFMFNWIGLPAISIPCGFIDGLPIGLQLVGQAGGEARLLRLAQIFLDAYPRPERPPAC